MTDPANKPDLAKLEQSLKSLCEIHQGLLSALADLPESMLSNEITQQLDLLKQFDTADITQTIDFIQFQETKSSATESSKAIEKLNELKAEINLKDQKIHDFKLSLADAVIEAKGINSKNKTLTEKITELEEQISQMMLHAKDQQLKLSTSQANLENETNSNNKLRLLRDALSEELSELKSAKEQLEKETSSLKEKIENLEENKNKSQVLAEKLAKEVSLLENHSAQTKERLSALEIRETELVATIGTLQKEKNHYQKRLNNLLTGVTKTISYERPYKGVPDDSDSVLEPRELLPYLPFCFPERLPASIKLKRKEKIITPAKLIQKNNKIRTSFLSKSELKTKTLTLRKSISRPNLPELKSPEFEFKFEKESAQFKPFELQITEYKKFLSPEFYFIDNFLSTDVYNSQNFHSKANNPTNRIPFSDIPNFGIYKYSLLLFLSYLSNRIFQKQYFQISRTEQLKNTTFKTVKKTNLIKEKNNLPEKLAFRSTYKLKFQKLKTPRKKFTYSFENKGKLQTVLETFGNTINTMVKKYHFLMPDANKTQK